MKEKTIIRNVHHTVILFISVQISCLQCWLKGLIQQVQKMGSCRTVGWKMSWFLPIYCCTISITGSNSNWMHLLLASFLWEKFCVAQWWNAAYRMKHSVEKVVKIMIISSHKSQATSSSCICQRKSAYKILFKKKIIQNIYIYKKMKYLRPKVRKRK